MDNTLTREILKKVRQVEIKTRRTVDDTLAGHYHSVFKGSGMNFDEVREYVPGDEVRRIDWKVTARTGHPFVKKYTEERELTILLMIDVSASGEFGSGEKSKRELMAELGSTLAFSAVRNNDKVGLILFSGEVELFIPPAKGRSHILRVIREILFFEPEGKTTDLTAALDFANGVIKRKAVTFLISDYCFPGGYDRALDAFRVKLKITSKRHDVIAVSVNDLRESELPDVGIITIEDAETGEQVELNTGSKRVRETFREIAKTRKDAFKHAVRSSGVDLLELETHKNYITPLLGFFGSRKRRLGR